MHRADVRELEVLWCRGQILEHREADPHVVDAVPEDRLERKAKLDEMREVDPDRPIRLRIDVIHRRATRALPVERGQLDPDRFLPRDDGTTGGVRRSWRARRAQSLPGRTRLWRRATRCAV